MFLLISAIPMLFGVSLQSMIGTLSLVGIATALLGHTFDDLGSSELVDESQLETNNDRNYLFICFITLLTFMNSFCIAYI